MYKKLGDVSSFSSFSLISSFFALVSFAGIFASYINFFNFCFLCFSFDSALVFFSVEETSVNTEIVARRVGSGLATAGLGGVGTGIGLVFSGLIKGFSRNPSLKDDLFSYAIFGFALTEAIGLFALMMAFMLLYA